MKPKYKRMIDGIKRKEKSSRKSRKEPWFLYILECCDGSFYTGITNDLTQRLKKHEDGKASRFTRTRRPVKMIYQEDCRDRARALVRECAVKALSRQKKEALVGR